MNVHSGGHADRRRSRSPDVRRREEIPQVLRGYEANDREGSARYDDRYGGRARDPIIRPREDTVREGSSRYISDNYDGSTRKASIPHDRNPSEETIFHGVQRAQHTPPVGLREVDDWLFGSPIPRQDHVREDRKAGHRRVENHEAERRSEEHRAREDRKFEDRRVEDHRAKGELLQHHALDDAKVRIPQLVILEVIASNG